MYFSRLKTVQTNGPQIKKYIYIKKKKKKIAYNKI